MTDQRFLYEIIAWMVVAAIVVFTRIRRPQLSVGLVAGYLVNLWLIHWPGAVTYVMPWYTAPDRDRVADGFHQSLIAVVAFALGALLLGPVLAKILEPPRSHSEESKVRRPDARLPWVYLSIGILGYTIIGRVLSGLPTVSAVAGGLRQLVIVGFALLLWNAWYAKDYRRFILIIACTAILPIATIVQEGFLGYGAMALIAIMTFTAVFARPRLPLLIFGLLVAYVGFSFYVTYMRDRAVIRGVVWGGQAVGNRLAQLQNTVSNFEWFDPKDPRHLDLVNARLNQNTLVGAATLKFELGDRNYAYGATVVDAFLGLIPRIVWPDKPFVAGSGSVVSDYTGFQFAAGTSVGVGQVLEFYINFGPTGIFLGFLLLGTVICLFDIWAAQRLWKGDWLQFAMWYLPGVSMLQAGGSLFEVMASAGAALVAVLIINRYVTRGPFGAFVTRKYH